MTWWKIRYAIRRIRYWVCGRLTGHQPRGPSSFIVQDQELLRRFILFDECARCGSVQYVAEERPLSEEVSDFEEAQIAARLQPKLAAHR